jgi:hypothetical protein
MPAERAETQPWLVAGRLLFAPFPPRDGGLTTGEEEAIQAMGERLERDRRAGRLPDCTAFWFNPADGQCTPLAASQAWLRSKVMRHAVVDWKLLQAMGRVVPLTLLPPPADRLHPSLWRRKPARVVRKAEVEAV